MGDLLKLDWDGRTYEVDLESIRVDEFQVIKQHTGMKMGQFVKAFTDIDELDSPAIAALLWVSRKRALGQAEWDTDFAPLELLGKMTKAEPPAGEAESEAPKVDS